MDDNAKAYAVDRAIQHGAEFQQWSKILLDKTAHYGIVFVELRGNWTVQVDGHNIAKGLTSPECFRLVLDTLEKKIRDHA